MCPVRSDATKRLRSYHIVPPAENWLVSTSQCKEYSAGSTLEALVGADSDSERGTAAIEQAPHRPRGGVWDRPRDELLLPAHVHAGRLHGRLHDAARQRRRGPLRGREPLRGERVERLARPAGQAEVVRAAVAVTVRGADAAGRARLVPRRFLKGCHCSGVLRGPAQRDAVRGGRVGAPRPRRERRGARGGLELLGAFLARLAHHPLGVLHRRARGGGGATVAAPGAD
eukprot:scaffold99105_cov60-Phaeocystis_antarctica.AAC.18